MAVYVSRANLTLSTSGTGWYRSEEFKLESPNNAGGYTNVLTSVQYCALTFANACNLIGAIIELSNGGSLVMSRDVTVTLQHYNGSSWDNVDSCTRTIGQIISYSGGNPIAVNGSYVYFEFASPQAVTTDANTWRLAVSQGGTTGNNWYVNYQDSGKTKMIRICVTDFLAGRPGASDCAVIKNTVTMDEDWTLGNQEDVANWPISMLIVNGGKFQLMDTPVSALTLSMTGLCIFYGDGAFYAGTTTPVSAANQFTINFVGPGSGKAYGFYGNTLHYNYGRFGELKLFGEKPTCFVTLTSNAAQGQADLVVTGDASGWNPGATIDILGGAGTSYASVEHKTISSIVGQTITLTTNLSYLHISGQAVVSRDPTMYGIVISFSGTGTSYILLQQGLAALTLSGVFFATYINPYTFNVYLGQREAFVLDHVMFAGPTMLRYVQYPSYTNVLDNIIVYSRGEYANGLALEYCKNLTASNIVAYDMSATGNMFGALILESDVNCTFNNIYLSGFRESATSACYINNSTKCAINNLRVSSGAYAIGLNLASETTVTTVEADYIGVAAIKLFGNSINNTIKDLTIARNGGASILAEFVADTFIANTVVQNAVGATGITSTYQTSIIHPSIFSVHSFGESGGNQHNNYLQAGNIVSTGDGLADTTVHTSGTGAFAIRFDTLDNSNRLEWWFKTPTGDISTKTMTVAVWCKINSATYYAGTHQKPRLTIDYDNGTETYAEATASTDWQLLSVTFSPTTSYGQITVTLSTMTDATGSDAYVYFDDMSVLYPAGYKLDLGGMDLWADALPITPPIATVLSAGDVWNLPASGLTGTGTIGQILNALVTGRYHYDKVGGIETIKDSSGNTVATFTVTDTATEVTKT